MDEWVREVLNLYKEYGEERAVKILNKWDSQGVMVLRELKNNRKSCFCPICGKQIYEVSIIFCPACGSKLQIHEEEQAFTKAGMRDWIFIGVKPSYSLEQGRTFLVCNVFGEKYPAKYSKQLDGFTDGLQDDMEDVISYLPMELPEEKRILKKICGRVSCEYCKYMRKEKGVLFCPSTQYCRGSSDYRRAVPRYKRPYFQRKEY